MWPARRRLDLRTSRFYPRYFTAAAKLIHNTLHRTYRDHSTEHAGPSGRMGALEPQEKRIGSMRNGLYSIHGGEEVSSGFTGKFSDDASEVFGTTLVGARSLSFHAVLKRLAEG